MFSKITSVLVTAGLFATLLLSSDARADRIGGPVFHTDTVLAHQTDVFESAFYRGSAHIEVNGDGDTDLDCGVVDSAGRLVVTDTDDTDYCILDFTVVRAGTFTLKIVNQGNVRNRYTVVIR